MRLKIVSETKTIYNEEINVYYTSTLEAIIDKYHNNIPVNSPSDDDYSYIVPKRDEVLQIAKYFYHRSHDNPNMALPLFNCVHVMWAIDKGRLVKMYLLEDNNGSSSNPRKGDEQA